MINRFSQNPTRALRAQQIYHILVGCAYDRKTLTYGMVADLLGYGGAGVLGQTLGYIRSWCIENDLPEINELVVGQESGIPGDGLDQLTDWNSRREQIYATDWFDIIPPTGAEIDAVHKSEAGNEP